MGIKIFAVMVSLVIVGIVLGLVRREKLTFKYACGWLFLSAAAIFFEVFDQYLFLISKWFGFTLPSNFIFFVLLAFFVLLSLFLTVFLCEQDNRNEIMAQKIAILELEVEQIKSTAHNETNPSSAGQ